MPDDLREVVDRKLSALVSGGPVRSVGYAPRDPYRGYPVARLLRAARRGLAATGGPRPYAYSNFGYAVLGQLLGRGRVRDAGRRTDLRTARHGRHVVPG